jgi:hypothetical protein
MGYIIEGFYIILGPPDFLFGKCIIECKPMVKRGTSCSPFGNHGTSKLLRKPHISPYL